MKPNFKFILLCTISLAVLALWFFRGKEISKPSPAPQISNANTLSAQNALASRTAERQTNNLAEASNTVANPKSPLTNLVTPQDRFRALVENKNTAINFWGLVVDQDGNPLAGANINGNTRTWYVTDTLGFDSRFPKVSAVSDANGKFSILNASGDDLTIKIQKTGYELEPNAKHGFGYHTSERFVADSNNPIVFKMWKTNIHKQLIIGEKRFQVVPDGRPYIIDLMRGTIAESGEGDLKVWVKRPDSIVFGQRYDWSCEMDVVNGGLLEENNRYSSMFSAPADGYVDIFQFEQKIGGGWGDSTGAKRFYVKLSNGREYGRISIELFAYYNDQIPGMIHLQYAINPTGSRILKP